MYTITNQDDSDEKPEDVAVEVDALNFKDGKLNIEDKKVTSNGNTSVLDDSVATYSRNLEVTGIKLK